MILFFHFICLLARYIFSNISKSISKRKVYTDDENEDDSYSSQSSYVLPDRHKYDKLPIYEHGTLRFFPPVYVQRYETVSLILQDPEWKGKIRKVVDFGCAELAFFMYLKNIEGIHEILEVDIDQEILERYSFKAAPLTTDYLMSKSTKPLDVYVLAGSIADYDDHLLGTDVVIGIELIEHLSEEAFNKMPYNIFHQVKPKLAIFTTPNADFNSLFPNFSGMRHCDHRFEWSRKEFYNWTQEIIQQYPEYSIRFYGIGAGPDGTENLGCCSQMAVFQRSDDGEHFSSAREKLVGINNYKLIKHFRYPHYVDTRTKDEKILHEIQYQVSHINAQPTFYDYEKNESTIPLILLKEYVADLCPDEEEFRNILQNSGMRVEMINGSWHLIYTESDLNSSSSRSSFREEDWLNEEIDYGPENKEDSVFEDDWDWDEGHLRIDGIANFQSARSLEGLESEVTERVTQELPNKPHQDGVTLNDPKSAPKSYDQLMKQLDIPKTDPKNKEVRKINSGKSKIPRKKNTVEEDSVDSCKKKSSLYSVRKPPWRISKSCSLDSCLENINCKPVESDSYCLNLILGGSVPFRTVRSLSSNQSKQKMNDSGSSLFSSSLDKAADSGYPFSFSPPDADLTPEQVDELFTENEVMSRSSSASSEVENFGAINPRVPHDLFVEDVVVENGDLANNNRDGEGNNVEGLVGQRLVNELAAERDPNDNMMFFPEIEEFPPWLLNLGELAHGPVYVPLDGDNYYEVGDDSSSDLNQSVDLEDVDIYEGLGLVPVFCFVSMTKQEDDKQILLEDTIESSSRII